MYIPSQLAIGRKHALAIIVFVTGSPSTAGSVKDSATVQAPQPPSLQPILVPVKPRFSRK